MIRVVVVVTYMHQILRETDEEPPIGGVLWLGIKGGWCGTGDHFTIYNLDYGDVKQERFASEVTVRCSKSAVPRDGHVDRILNNT